MLCPLAIPRAVDVKKKKKHINGERAVLCVEEVIWSGDVRKLHIKPLLSFFSSYIYARNISMIRDALTCEQGRRFVIDLDLIEWL